MRDVWKYSALWPVAAGTLPPYWENRKMVEQAQNRRILTGRLTCAVHPLQTLLLCAQKEEVRQRVRVHGEGTERRPLLLSAFFHSHPPSAGVRPRFTDTLVIVVVRFTYFHHEGVLFHRETE